MAEAILAAISNFILNAIDTLGYLGVFLLMIAGGANIPIPSEVVMTFSGFLVAIGEFKFWLIVLVGTLGDVTGSLISYLIAHRVSDRIKTNHEFQRAEKWFEKFGVIALFLGKLTPFLRTFISFPAGIFKIKLWKFLLFVTAGALIWSTALVYLGSLLGENWSAFQPYFRKFDFVIVIILVIGLIWWLRHRFKRQNLVSSI